jgi:hypothetical protein
MAGIVNLALHRALVPRPQAAAARAAGQTRSS